MSRSYTKSLAISSNRAQLKGLRFLDKNQTIPWIQESAMMFHPVGIVVLFWDISEGIQILLLVEFSLWNHTLSNEEMT
jgi:hypothetical protein